MPLLAETRWNNDQNLAFAFRPLLGKQNPSFYRLSEPDLVRENRALGEPGAKREKSRLDLMGWSCLLEHQPETPLASPNCRRRTAS
jgi:hypothetical protein